MDDIWVITNTEIDGELSTRKVSRGKTKVSNFIKGRDIVASKEKNVERGSEDIKKLYISDSEDKLMLMKFVTAAGREDEVGIFLKHAGFWKNDLHQIEEKYKTDVVLSMADRTDKMFIYALRYRDELLKEWANKLKNDDEEYIVQAKKEFPFIKLLQMINRDIQYVNKNILSSNTAVRNLENKLIYPIVESEY